MQSLNLSLKILSQKTFQKLLKLRLSLSVNPLKNQGIIAVGVVEKRKTELQPNGNRIATEWNPNCNRFF